MSNSQVGTIYQQIIDDVLDTSRVDLEENGVDESILEELKLVSNPSPCTPARRHHKPAAPRLPSFLYPIHYSPCSSLLFLQLATNVSILHHVGHFRPRSLVHIVGVDRNGCDALTALCGGRPSESGGNCWRRLVARRGRHPLFGFLCRLTPR